MQIKVTDTRMHVTYSDGIVHTEVSVAEAKLVGIERHGKGAGKEPILISETEKIEVDDWKYSKAFGICKHDDCEMGNYDTYFKVLALPEHFSPKHLQAIVDGKMRDGDRVLVECESKLMEPHKDQYGDLRENKFENTIKLNSSNHITFHKVEEKMYSWDKVFKVVDEYFLNHKGVTQEQREEFVDDIMNGLNKM